MKLPKIVPFNFFPRTPHLEKSRYLEPSRKYKPTVGRTPRVGREKCRLTQNKKPLSNILKVHLVLAGPGTGKTQLLSAKVAYILEHTDANPENILCLTFTDAGAEKYAIASKP